MNLIVGSPTRKNEELKRTQNTRQTNRNVKVIKMDKHKRTTRPKEDF